MALSPTWIRNATEILRRMLGCCLTDKHLGLQYFKAFRISAISLCLLPKFFLKIFVFIVWKKVSFCFVQAIIFRVSIESSFESEKNQAKMR